MTEESGAEERKSQEALGSRLRNRDAGNHVRDYEIESETTSIVFIMVVREVSVRSVEAQVVAS